MRALAWILCGVCIVVGLTPRLAAQEASEAEQKVEKRLQSLYGDGKTKRPLSKPKAHKKHDRVTFVINESVNAKQEATSALNRDSEMDWQLEKFFTIKLDKNGNVIAVPRLQTTNDTDTSSKSGEQKPEVNFTTARTHDADGEIERKSNVTDEISGEVLDVLPNGHLIVQAKKSIKVDGESTMVTLSGRVDPKDLTADSKIDSKLVVDMRIKFEGAGDIRDMQKRGWGSKILDKINPF